MNECAAKEDVIAWRKALVGALEGSKPTGQRAAP
jgi:hypothetical protein